jgi:drug/metabolite transporter (DMT)-like permease
VGPHLWIICSVSAAILWGFTYATSGKMMEWGLTPAFLLLTQYVIALPVYAFIAHRSGGFRASFENLAAHPARLALFLTALALGIVANFLIMFSISLKNATLASLIEISYPVFTMLFALIVYRETHLTPAAALGAALIFAGIGIIYLKS